jgi:hypothetical protein
LPFLKIIPGTIRFSAVLSAGVLGFNPNLPCNFLVDANLIDTIPQNYPVLLSISFSLNLSYYVAGIIGMVYFICSSRLVIMLSSRLRPLSLTNGTGEPTPVQNLQL